MHADHYLDIVGLRYLYPWGEPRARPAADPPAAGRAGTPRCARDRGLANGPASSTPRSTRVEYDPDEHPRDRRRCGCASSAAATTSRRGAWSSTRPMGRDSAYTGDTGPSASVEDGVRDADLLLVESALWPRRARRRGTRPPHARGGDRAGAARRRPLGDPRPLRAGPEGARWMRCAPPPDRGSGPAVDGLTVTVRPSADRRRSRPADLERRRPPSGLPARPAPRSAAQVRPIATARASAAAIGSRPRRTVDRRGRAGSSARARSAACRQNAAASATAPSARARSAASRSSGTARSASPAATRWAAICPRRPARRVPRADRRAARAGRAGGWPADRRRRRRGSAGGANRHASSSMRQRSARWRRAGRRRPARAARRAGSPARPRRNRMPMTEATPSTSRASGASASMRAPSTARSVIGTRGRPSRSQRHAAVAPARACRPRGTPGRSRPTNSGLPPVRSWMLRAPSASTRRPRDERRELGGVRLGEAVEVEARRLASRVAHAGSGPGRVAGQDDERVVGRPLDDEVDHRRRSTDRASAGRR